MDTKFKIGDKVRDILTGREDTIDSIDYEFFKAVVDGEILEATQVSYGMTHGSYRLPESMLVLANSEKPRLSKGSSRASQMRWRLQDGLLFLSTYNHPEARYVSIDDFYTNGATSNTKQPTFNGKTSPHVSYSKGLAATKKISYGDTKWSLA